MLFGSLNRFITDPFGFLVQIAILMGVIIIAISVHEFAHAWSAHKLGDNTATSLGRLTLNPLAHLDPLGTLLLLFVGFGWGKPVPVNPYNLRGDPRRGMALVALAGPVSNVLQAAIAAAILRSVVDLPSFAVSILSSFLLINVILAVFNMIPLPPLDGYRILVGILPHDLAVRFSRLEAQGPMLLLLVLMLDSFGGTHIVSSIMGPPMQLLTGVLLGRV